MENTCQTNAKINQIQNFNNSIVEWIDHRKGLICLKNKSEHQTSNNICVNVITTVFHIKELGLSKPERRRLRKGDNYVVPQQVLAESEWEIL